MGLRQRKRLCSFELPEFVAVVLIGAAIVPVTLWWQGRSAAEYAQADGVITACEIRPKHYNATDYANEVTITYQYTAGNETYTKTWTGLWPETESPNALAPDRLEALRDKNHPLAVFYDPENPAEAQLHIQDNGFQRIYGGLALGLCGVAILFCATVYPAWRAYR